MSDGTGGMALRAEQGGLHFSMPSRLQELEGSRPAFESWLRRAQQKVGSRRGGNLLAQIHTEYSAFDQVRQEAIALYDAGRIQEAKAKQDDNDTRTQRLRDLFIQLGADARIEAQRTFEQSEHAVRRLAHVLVATSIGGNRTLAAQRLGITRQTLSKRLGGAGDERE